MSSEERNIDVNQGNTGDSMNTKDFLIGALIGGIVGAATALFLAPKSGKELRQDLNEQAAVLKEKTDQLRETATVKGSELAAAAKEKTSTLSQTVSKQSAEIVNKVKGLAQDAVENVEEMIQSDEEPSPTEKADSDDVQQKLEETKRAFAETEDNLQNTSR